MRSLSNHIDFKIEFQRPNMYNPTGKYELGLKSLKGKENELRNGSSCLFATSSMNGDTCDDLCLFEVSVKFLPCVCVQVRYGISFLSFQSDSHLVELNTKQEGNIIIYAIEIQSLYTVSGGSSISQTGVANSQGGGANLLFGQFKKLDPEGGSRP